LRSFRIVNRNPEGIESETIDIFSAVVQDTPWMAGGNAQQSAVFAGIALGKAQGGARNDSVRLVLAATENTV
jgi:hypothetical protein